MPGDDWLDLSAVAQWMGLGKTTVYRMIRRGELRVSGGRPNRVRRADLVEHVARCRLEAGALAALNDYSPTRWRPRGRRVADPARFEAAVAEVLAGVGEGEVVSYQGVATEAGYPTRAKAVRDHLARSRSGLPWWRVTQADGCLSVPDAQEQAQALRTEGVVVTDRRVRRPRPRRP